MDALLKIGAQKSATIANVVVVKVREKLGSQYGINTPLGTPCKK